MTLNIILGRLEGLSRDDIGSHSFLRRSPVVPQSPLHPSTHHTERRSVPDQHIITIQPADPLQAVLQGQAVHFSRQAANLSRVAGHQQRAHSQGKAE